MIRHDYSRVDPKRRANLDYKKRQFAKAEFQQQNYEHRLNFYVLPPTAEITLDEFETWAINRLKGMRVSTLDVGPSLTMQRSPFRTRSMQFPQQRPRRDGRIHEEHSRKVPTVTISFDEKSKTARGEKKRPLFALHTTTGLFVHRGTPAAVFAARNYAVHTTVQRR